MGNSLGELIVSLEDADPDYIPPIGFGAPDSYRGDYADLAFGPERGVSVAQMLAHARSALGATYQGYKGGDYTMNKYTTCWISNYGTCDGDAIGPVLRAYLTGKTQVPVPEEIQQ